MEEAGLLAPLLLSLKLVDIATALALVAFLCETIASDFRFSCSVLSSVSSFLSLDGCGGKIREDGAEGRWNGLPGVDSVGSPEVRAGQGACAQVGGRSAGPGVGQVLRVGLLEGCGCGRSGGPGLDSPGHEGPERQVVEAVGCHGAGFGGSEGGVPD